MLEGCGGLKNYATRKTIRGIIAMEFSEPVR
jgi:hypothetical protein